MCASGHVCTTPQSGNRELQRRRKRGEQGNTQRITSQNFVFALKKCSTVRDLEGGKRLHLDAVAANYHTDKYVAAALITMYTKCGSMQLAREVFDSTAHRDVVTWNSLLMGYVENGESSKSMDMYASMDCEPDSFTYLAMIKACVGMVRESESEKQLGLEKGIAIHEQVKEQGFDSVIYVANTLVDMYGKCGSMRRARDVFESTVHRNVVTWNCLLRGYVENGKNSFAMEMFTNMDCEPDSFTYFALIKACAGLATEIGGEKQLCLEKGIAFHKQVKEHGFLDTIVFVGNALIDMYAKCGSMQDAREVFDRMIHKDAVTWTSLLMGYVENGESSVAMELFNKMDCKPTHVTYIAVLKACAGLSVSGKEYSLERGIAIHKQVKDRGLDSEVVVASTLVDMYGKCGSTSHAQDVFDRMHYKDAVVWTSLLLGYVENGESSMALELFSSMDCKPDSLIYVAALKACGCLCALRVGEWITAEICRLGSEANQVVINMLVDFYGKCGNLTRAEHMFNNVKSPDIVSWNALIAGYSSVGESSQVFTLAKNTQEAGLQLDGVTFIWILTVCSHAGLVEVCKTYFERMYTYGICPTVDHYTCMIDMLGRANRLDEALLIIQSMPFEATSVTWRALLSVCRKFKNLEVGKVAFDALVKGNMTDAADYVLMGDIYGIQAMSTQRSV